jgi:hypothetical protein
MKVFYAILFISALNLFLSCSTTEPESEYTGFKIQVDSLVLSRAISIGDTLIVKFYGFVGPDGCHEFWRFEDRKKNDGVDITVWGRKPLHPTACPDVLVYLEGEEYFTIPTQTGYYKIKVNQPDNSILIDSVSVR